MVVQEDTKVKEFPSTNREQSIYTDHCIAEGKNTETDEDNLSHGTNVASAALGQYHGVAKGATLVPVKYYGPLTDMALALFKAEQDILGKNRQQNSIVVLTAGGESATDPVDILRQAPAAADTYKVIRRLHDNGVPVITPAGNDRDQGRDKIDFWPSYWEADDFPLINVAETDDEGIRSEFSQAGDKVTTWAATYPAWVQFKDGKSKEEAGTSLGKSYIFACIYLAKLTKNHNRFRNCCRRHCTVHVFRRATMGPTYRQTPRRSDSPVYERRPNERMGTRRRTKRWSNS